MYENIIEGSNVIRPRIANQVPGYAPNVNANTGAGGANAAAPPVDSYDGRDPEKEEHEKFVRDLRRRDDEVRRAQYSNEEVWKLAEETGNYRIVDLLNPPKGPEYDQMRRSLLQHMNLVVKSDNPVFGFLKQRFLSGDHSLF